MVEKLPDWFKVAIAKEQREELPDWFLEAIGEEQRVEELDDNTVELHKNKAKGEVEAQLRNAVGTREAPRFGYDSWYGRGSSRGPVAPPKLPTRMKVKEVIEWQNTHNPPGPETTAIGRYQIVDQPNARTLSNLVRTMGLTGEELFTAELQDRMADTLMEGRGLSKFKAGKITAKQFAREMSKEWAGLPVLEDTVGARGRIKRGQSYYQNDGINSSQKVGDTELKAYEEIYASFDIENIGG
jgi:hypothetical protein